MKGAGVTSLIERIENIEVSLAEIMRELEHVEGERKESLTNYGGLMKFIFWVAVATVLGCASAWGQSTDFKCAKAGMVIENSDGSRVTWQGQRGDTCLVSFKATTGEENSFVWYAPTLALRADRSQAFAQQVKPSTLWPLTVGKKLTGRYDGVGTDSTGTGSWSETISVDSYEKITTKAGTFDVFVVTRREESLSSKFKSTARNWYAPALGSAVKTTYTDSNGGNRSYEAVTIR